MSLISLTSVDKNDHANFRNNFYKGIKLPPNSEVACVSAVMNYTQTLIIDNSNDTIIIQVGEEEALNEGKDYKIPHGTYTLESLISTLNSFVLTTLHVAYLRIDEDGDGGFTFIFNDASSTPVDIEKGITIRAHFAPLSTSEAPSCSNLDFFGKPDGTDNCSIGSNDDGTLITKTSGRDNYFDGLFVSDTELMENQHATFVIRKANGTDWDTAGNHPAGIYGIFSATDFTDNTTTKFFREEYMDDATKSVRPLFGFEIYKETNDKVYLQQVESDYITTLFDGNTSRQNGLSTPPDLVELDDAVDVYYLRMWLGQKDTIFFDNNCCFYFLTSGEDSANDTFVASNATFKSFMKYGTKFYPLKVGGGIMEPSSKIALEMCSATSTLSEDVLQRLANEFQPSNWNPSLDYDKEFISSLPIFDDGGISNARPARTLIFGMGESDDFDYGYKVATGGNFGSVMDYAPLTFSNTITAGGGDTYYASAPFNTGEIIKPYTTSQPSTHIQLTNLPIQSYNGVSSSVVRTIAVIPRQKYNGYTGTWNASQLVWININNAEELVMSEIDIRITDNSNKVVDNLTGDTEIVLMFK
tara:strand:+ start:2225 stop:3976 length:1752 start_codon:yes stop_codon:yes gene_type:complete